MTTEDNNSTQNSLRYNENKPRFDYLSFPALVPLVKVLEYGAHKYALNNWKKPPSDSNEHLASMLRHVASILEGEQFDAESGLPHIGHIMCNAMFYSFHNLNLYDEVLKQPVRTFKKDDTTDTGISPGAAG